MPFVLRQGTTNYNLLLLMPLSLIVECHLLAKLVWEQWKSNLNLKSSYRPTEGTIIVGDRSIVVTATKVKE